MPLIDDEGEFEGALLIYHDVTDLLRAEEDERTQVMLDAAPLACIFWDEDGNLLDCNKETLKLFGVGSKQEFFDRFYEFSSLVPVDESLSRNNARKYLAEAIRAGRKELEWTYRTAAGERLPTEVTLVRVSWRNTARRVVSYIRDLREIKAAEEKVRAADIRSRELEVQIKSAQAASETKSKFLASISHEISTPMNAIIGMSELMRTDNLDGQQLSFFTDLKKMSASLLRIINDVLDISKIEMGKMEILQVHFNLWELYDNICSLNRFSAESKNLKFRPSFGADVPQVIYGDDVRIRQIVTNILNNAVKYTQRGYVDFQVRRRVFQGQDYLAFIVKDTGIGIKKENFLNVFGLFQRFDLENNRGVMGTGLGLAITKNLVELMQGQIFFDSVYGQGSEFTVLLPLVEGDPAKIEQRILHSQIKASRDVNVLVVDDNSINLKVALAYLALHNIRADTAETWAEALEKTAKQPYDIVFMDHMMPGIDGVEVVKRIRKMDKPWAESMPIIALTADAISGIQETFLNAGMNDFISKPIDAGELNQKLAKWLPRNKIAGIKEQQEKKSEVSSKPLRHAVFDRAAVASKVLGDESLYEEIVNTFREKHGGDYEEIAKALAAGDYAQAYRIAHTLKSVAGLMGAGHLRKAALLVEKVLANGQTPGGELLAVLEREFVDLWSALDAQSQEEPPPDPADQYQAEKAEYVAASGDPSEEQDIALFLIRRLQPLLVSGNAGSLDLVGDIRKHFVTYPNKARLLCEQIEDFEFTEAVKTLQDIKELFAMPKE
jgi:PAS domain S-box-containing protein